MRGFLAVIFLGLALSGCAALPDYQRQALIGAGLGAGAGALIGASIVGGAAAAGGPAAIAIGAAVGGAAGGIIAANLGKPACYFRNKRGEIWMVPCEDERIRREACFVGHPVAGVEQVYCPWEKRRRT